MVALTPHVFRHSYAMHHLLQGNTHIKRLQAYLGHRSLRSTEVYTAVLALDAAASEIGLSFRCRSRAIHYSVGELTFNCSGHRIADTNSAAP